MSIMKKNYTLFLSSIRYFFTIIIEFLMTVISLYLMKFSYMKYIIGVFFLNVNFNY